MPTENQNQSSPTGFIDLPGQPTGTTGNQANAMPRACAREHGDYSDGDYAVAVKTAQAPSLEDSTFSQTLTARCAR